ncbi:MAG: SH3 domain-containing protein [Hyphomicrobiaceae bacterium]
MRGATLLGAILACTMLGSAAVQAATPGFTTANVNMRTGPDTDYPSVGVIPEGDDIFVEGCLRDESWCDVRWAGNRGWVYSEYLAIDRRGHMVRLPDIGAVAIGVPLITFAAADYWGRYYVGRPWYRDRARWYAYTPRPRAGWRAPPPGPRRAGWWRSDYHAPRGMRPPSDREWRRPDRRGPGGRVHVDGPRDGRGFDGRRDGGRDHRDHQDRR